MKLMFWFAPVAVPFFAGWFLVFYYGDKRTNLAHMNQARSADTSAAVLADFENYDHKITTGKRLMWAAAAILFAEIALLKMWY